MPTMTHKFSTQSAADAFVRRLVKLGFKPYQTRRTKFVRGLKRFYIEVQYKR